MHLITPFQATLIPKVVSNSVLVGGISGDKKATLICAIETIARNLLVLHVVRAYSYIANIGLIAPVGLALASASLLYIAAEHFNEDCYFLMSCMNIALASALVAKSLLL